MAEYHKIQCLCPKCQKQNLEREFWGGDRWRIVCWLCGYSIELSEYECKEQGMWD